MAAFSGTAGSVFMSSIQLSEISEWSLDCAMAPVETTEFGQSNDRYVPSVRSATGSFMANSDVGTALPTSRPKNAFLQGDDQYQLKLYSSADAMFFSLSSVKINGMSPAVTVKGKNEISYNFTGEITTFA